MIKPCRLGTTKKVNKGEKIQKEMKRKEGKKEGGERRRKGGREGGRKEKKKEEEKVGEGEPGGTKSTYETLKGGAFQDYIKDK